MWEVIYTNSFTKQLGKLPDVIQKRMAILSEELERFGPMRPNWKNFGLLKGSGTTKIYHCHIKSGKPTYVACWEVKDKSIKLIEVYYVGTHENAPY